MKTQLVDNSSANLLTSSRMRWLTLNKTCVATLPLLSPYELLVVARGFTHAFIFINIETKIAYVTQEYCNILLVKDYYRIGELVPHITSYIQINKQYFLFFFIILLYNIRCRYKSTETRISLFSTINLNTNFHNYIQL